MPDAEPERGVDVADVGAPANRDEQGAREPRDLGGGRALGEGAVARTDEDSRIAAARVAIDQPVGDRGQVDLPSSVSVRPSMAPIRA